jgi:hypothetical protein
MYVIGLYYKSWLYNEFNMVKTSTELREVYCCCCYVIILILYWLSAMQCIVPEPEWLLRFFNLRKPTKCFNQTAASAVAVNAK